MEVNSLRSWKLNWTIVKMRKPKTLQLPKLLSCAKRITSFFNFQFYSLLLLLKVQ